MTFAPPTGRRLKSGAPLARWAPPKEVVRECAKCTHPIVMASWGRWVHVASSHQYATLHPGINAVPTPTGFQHMNPGGWAAPKVAA